ncbi:hypothetical protein CYMTET_43973, partial [Cymbomonas tetramitiformis]
KLKGSQGLHAAQVRRMQQQSEYHKKMQLAARERAAAAKQKWELYPFAAQAVEHLARTEDAHRKEMIRLAKEQLQRKKDLTRVLRQFQSALSSAFTTTQLATDDGIKRKGPQLEEVHLRTRPSSAGNDGRPCSSTIICTSLDNQKEHYFKLRPTPAPSPLRHQLHNKQFEAMLREGPTFSVKEATLSVSDANPNMSYPPPGARTAAAAAAGKDLPPLKRTKMVAPSVISNTWSPSWGDAPASGVHHVTVPSVNPILGIMGSSRLPPQNIPLAEPQKPSMSGRLSV